MEGERLKNALQEKLQALETKLIELEGKYKMDEHTYGIQIEQLKDQVENEKKPLISELEKYKALCNQLEIDKNETHALLDKEKALWESSFLIFTKKNIFYLFL